MSLRQLEDFIPKGFSLDKYDASANLTLESWIINLSSRALAFQVSDIKTELEDSQLEFIRHLNQQNIENGVIQDAKSGQMLRAMAMADEAHYNSIVREITYLELFQITTLLKTPELEELYLEAKITPFTIVNQKFIGDLNKPIPYSDLFIEDQMSLLQIDMNCSDSEIQTAFADWLKKSRETSSNQRLSKRREHRLKNFNNVAFRKWHDARVLAYLDLISWNRIQGNKITSKIMGDILFPETNQLRDTTAMINDTIKPLAEKLTDMTTLRRMAKVFADENRQKNT